jgi:hypothetical protein
MSFLSFVVFALGSSSSSSSSWGRKVVGLKRFWWLGFLGQRSFLVVFLGQILVDIALAVTGRAVVVLSEFLVFFAIFTVSNSPVPKEKKKKDRGGKYLVSPSPRRGWREQKRWAWSWKEKRGPSFQRGRPCARYQGPSRRGPCGSQRPFPA